jgi:hypothetical protein
MPLGLVRYAIHEPEHGEFMETRTVKPRNQLPNTLLPLMPMVVILSKKGNFTLVIQVVPRSC